MRFQMSGVRKKKHRGSRLKPSAWITPDTAVRV
jgi:hypothetical protein